MKFLLKVYPQESHYNATLALAAALRSLSHSVVYAGSPSFKRFVEANGFDFVPHADPIYSEVQNTGTPPLTLWNLLRAHRALRRSSARLRSLALEVDLFAPLLEAHQPDILLIDSPYTLLTLPLLRRGVPYALLESMGNLNQQPDCPPLDTTFVPTGSWLSRRVTELHWVRYAAKRRLLGWAGVRIDYTGDFLRALARRWQVPFNRIERGRYFHPGLREVPEILLSPAELEFPRALRASQIFFQSAELSARQTTVAPYRFSAVLTELARARQAGRPLVYCSLGTAGWRYAGANTFIARLIAAAEGQRWNLLVATGDLPTPNKLPPNVHVFRSVPQLDVLAETDLMVTHGGMNSVRECMERRVRMLVCPGTQQIDQPGNAARVAYHGHGALGSLRHTSPRQLRTKIESQLTFPRPARPARRRSDPTEFVARLVDLLQLNATEIRPGVPSVRRQPLAEQPTPTS